MGSLKKIEKCTGFIEATGYEKLCLWQNYKSKEKWIEDNCGLWLNIGCMDIEKPVCISLFFANINEKNVCFYETTSRFAD